MEVMASVFFLQTLVSSLDNFLMTSTFRNGIALSVSTSVVNLTIGLKIVSRSARCSVCFFK